MRLPVALAGLSVLGALTGAEFVEDPVVCVLESSRIEVRHGGREAQVSVEMVYAVNEAGEDAERIRWIQIFNAFPVYAREADVRIHNRRGLRYKASLGDFDEVQSPGRSGIFITDDRWKVLHTDPLEAGDTLRVQYEIDQKPFLGFGVRTLPQTDLPVRRSIYQIEADEDLAPRYRTWNGAGDPVEIRAGGRVRWTWSRENPEPYEPEPYGPPAEDVLPTVSIGVNAIAWGPAETWSSLGTTYWNQAMDRVRGLPSDVVLPARGGSRASPLARCLERTQNNIRYVAIELGEGGLIPHPSTETVRRKYGDCKDMATVLLSLLQSEAGGGSLAAVRTRGHQNGLVIDPLPTLNFFNHMVVCAEDAGGERWLDATHPYGTVASPRHDIQGGAALVISGPNPGYRRIPVSDPATNRTTRWIRLREEDPRRWRVDLRLQWSGAPAQNLRGAMESGQELEELIRKIVRDLECTPRGVIESEAIGVLAPAPDTLTVSVSFPIEDPMQGRTLTPCWTREPYPLSVFASRERETDVYWPLPGVFADTLIVESRSLAVGGIPDTTWSETVESIRFQGEQRQDGSAVQLVRTMVITDLTFPVSRWTEARKARTRLLRWSSRNLVAES